MTTTSPRPTVRSSSRSTSRDPNDLRTRSTSTSGPPALDLDALEFLFGLLDVAAGYGLVRRDLTGFRQDFDAAFTLSLDVVDEGHERCGYRTWGRRIRSILLAAITRNPE